MPNGRPHVSGTSVSGRPSRSRPSSTSSPRPTRRRTRCRSSDRRWSVSACSTPGCASCNAALAGEIDVNFEVAPEPTWRPLSRWGLVAVVVGLVIAGGGFLLDLLNILDLGMAPLFIGIAIALIGVILTAVALWLRRGSRANQELRDVEIDRRLRGRSEMEAELRQAEADTAQQLGTLGLDDLAAAEDLLGREEAHVARMDQLSAQLDGLVGKEPRETLPKLARHGRPRDRAEDERPREPRADRQGTASARAPRGGGARPGGRARSRSGR